MTRLAETLIAALGVDTSPPKTEIAGLGTLINVLASASLRTESGSSGTDALESTRQVLALTTTASRGPCCTLIHVHALLSSGVALVALVAKTLVAASKILTGTVLTEAAGDLGTLVDVVPTVVEPGTMWAQLVVFQAARAWARGARRAPTEYIGKLNSTTTTC